MNTTERIIGVDYGSKRIGLSISDPLGIIARPVDALANDGRFFAALKAIVEREQIKLFVVGMPFNLKGQVAFKAEEVRDFIDRLKREIGLDVVPWDERFTTSIAQQTLREMGTKKSERQKKDGRIDSMAAAILLQSYLDIQNIPALAKDGTIARTAAVSGTDRSRAASAYTDAGIFWQGRTLAMAA